MLLPLKTCLIPGAVSLFWPKRDQHGLSLNAALGQFAKGSRHFRLD